MNINSLVSREPRDASAYIFYSAEEMYYGRIARASFIRSAGSFGARSHMTCDRRTITTWVTGYSVTRVILCKLKPELYNLRKQIVFRRKFNWSLSTRRGRTIMKGLNVVSVNISIKCSQKLLFAAAEES